MSLESIDERCDQLRTAGQIREVPIPIQGMAWPTLKAVFPMTEAAWQQMIAVLNAMKPGLVCPQPDADPGRAAPTEPTP